MNYTFNKTLIEQVKAGTHCIEFNREKDSLEMLQALCKEAWPVCIYPKGDCKYYFAQGKDSGFWTAYYDNRGLAPIPLSNFVQPEQSERDVMAELDERLKRLEDILLRDNEPCKAEQTKEEYAKERAIGFFNYARTWDYEYDSQQNCFYRYDCDNNLITIEPTVIYDEYLKSLLQTQD